MSHVSHLPKQVTKSYHNPRYYIYLMKYYTYLKINFRPQILSHYFHHVPQFRAAIIFTLFRCGETTPQNAKYINS